MIIIIKRFSKYKDTRIVEGGTTIDLGLLDEKEGKALAQQFREAAEHLEEEYA